MAHTEPDYRKIFESSPRAYLVLTPEFTIVAVSDIYLAVSMTKRDQILGKYLFDVFPDNPNDPTADGVANLTRSLNTVLRTKKPHIMSLQKYDVQNPHSKNGEFEVKFWRPENWPVLDEQNNVKYIIHCVEEATHLVDVLNDAVDKQKEIEQNKKP